MIKVLERPVRIAKVNLRHVSTLSCLRLADLSSSLVFVVDICRRGAIINFREIALKAYLIVVVCLIFNFHELISSSGRIRSRKRIGFSVKILKELTDLVLRGGKMSSSQCFKVFLGMYASVASKREPVSKCANIIPLERALFCKI